LAQRECGGASPLEIRGRLTRERCAPVIACWGGHGRGSRGTGARLGLTLSGKLLVFQTFRQAFSNSVLFSASRSKHFLGGFERFQGLASPPSPISFSPNFSPLGVAAIGFAFRVPPRGRNRDRALPAPRIQPFSRRLAKRAGRLSDATGGPSLPRGSGIARIA